MPFTRNRDLTRAAGTLTDAMTALEEGLTFQRHLIRDEDYAAAALARPVLGCLEGRMWAAREAVIAAGGTITLTVTTLEITDVDGGYATRILRGGLPQASSYYGLATAPTTITTLVGE